MPDDGTHNLRDWEMRFLRSMTHEEHSAFVERRMAEFDAAAREKSNAE